MLLTIPVLPVAILFISFVKADYEGDKYFPEINYDEFKLVWDNETDLVHYTQYERVR